MNAVMGVVGLGVMGANLARNAASNGLAVAGYDVDAAKVRALTDGSEGIGAITGVHDVRALAEALERPRRVLIMVPAGAPVDSVIAHLRPHLEAGDILIDGGNSHFADTDRRADDLAAAGLHFVGAGISGGEEGARLGPSIMPGGPREAWQALSTILRAIAARADDGEPCVDYMGPRGAGHFVKMVHNGIEYADMQLIAEIYDLLRRGAGLSAADIADLFAEWNRGELRSFLIEITADLLRRADPETGLPLVDVIVDEAQQKGTGKWTSQTALDLGAPVPTIDAAVSARIVSSLKADRERASRVLAGPPQTSRPDRAHMIDRARQALFASKVVAYAQGFTMFRLASDAFGYGIPSATVAKIWRAGCIIRAELLGSIRDAYAREPGLDNLLLDSAIRSAVGERQDAWRDVVQTAVAMGVPVPAISASLAYYDAYRTARLPANLVQAQRDYFGAHTYRRVDRPGVFHTDWTARPGDERS